MDRREFLKLLAQGALAIGASQFLQGCLSKDEKKELTIEGKNYSLENRVLIQKSETKTSFRLGILADTHANTLNTQFFVDQLLKEKVDAFLYSGDLSWSFGDYQGSKNDYEEILAVAEPAASTGKLLLMFPGNHEQQEKYARATQSLTEKYANVIDMEKIPVVDLNQVTIVGLGGNDNPRFTVQNGFLRATSDFEELGRVAKVYQKNKPLLIATHLPQKYTTERGLDLVENGKIHVGSSDLARIRKALDSKFATSAHIHEAFGIIRPDENPVKPDELVDGLDFYPGAVFDHLQRPYLKPAAGILEFVEDKARAYILDR